VKYISCLHELLFMVSSHQSLCQQLMLSVEHSSKFISLHGRFNQTLQETVDVMLTLYECQHLSSNFWQ